MRSKSSKPAGTASYLRDIQTLGGLEMANHEWQLPSQPPKKRHRARNVILGIVAALVVLITIGAVVGGNKSKTAGNPAANVPSASPVASPSRSQAAPGLPPGQAKFVAAIRAKLSAGGFANDATDAQFAGVGATICKARAAGATQAALIGAGTGEGQEQVQYAAPAHHGCRARLLPQVPAEASPCACQAVQEW
jgi:hypothetical protein